MPGPRLDHVRAFGAVDAAPRTDDHGRAFVVGLVDVGAQPACPFPEGFPGGFEFRFVAFRAVARQEFGIGCDSGLDEVPAGLLEDRAPLVGVGGQQRVAAPAFDPGRQLPAEVGRILQPVVEAEAAVGRVAVRRVAGDEHAAHLVVERDLHPEIPEPHVVEFAGELEPRGLLDEAVEVVVEELKKQNELLLQLVSKK